MRIVVTGAAGFIGSHVAELLVAEGHSVLGLDDLTGAFRENVPAEVEFEERDCQLPVDDLFGRFRPEAVYHLAAYAAEGLSHHIPVFNYSNNIVATANVLSAAYRCQAKHFVFTSSIAAYGHPHGVEAFDENSPCNPCDPYGIAKLACEYHIRAFHDYFGGPNYTIFRPHNVFGPRQNISDPYRNVVAIFLRCALQGQPMPLFGDGLQTRSFSYIDTVSKCIADAPFASAARNETFNVGGDEPMAVKELAKQIAIEMGVPENIKFLPPRKEVMHAHCSHKKVRDAFPKAYVNPINIVSGLKLMAAFVKSNPVPHATECPSAIEIADLLPPSWSERLIAEVGK
jgi:UDP-glucose 4-epimerase